MKRKLYLIAKTFPHEGGETAFLSPEFPYLLKNFDVTVITTEPVMESPKASSEINIDLQTNLLDKLSGVLRFLFHADAWKELSDIMWNISAHDVYKKEKIGRRIRTYSTRRRNKKRNREDSGRNELG